MIKSKPPKYQIAICNKDGACMVLDIEEVKPLLPYFHPGDMPLYTLTHACETEIGITALGMIAMGEKFIEIGRNLRQPDLERYHKVDGEQ